MVNVAVNGVEVPFELDTGATRTVISKHTFERTFTNLPPLQPSDAILRKYGNVPIPVCGEAMVSVCRNGKTKNLSLIVVNEKGPTLLGRDWMEALEVSLDDMLATKSSEPSMQNITVVNIEELLGEFPTLFDESRVGNLKG